MLKLGDSDYKRASCEANFFHFFFLKEVHYEFGMNIIRNYFVGFHCFYR